MIKETNMEHFRSEIEELVNKINCLYIPAVVDGKPVPCNDNVECNICEFHSSGVDCAVSFVKWLMSEYKPEPVLTEREKHFVEFAQVGWLARDEDGSLYWYELKPTKDSLEDSWDIFGEHTELGLLAVAMFPFITWEDESPWSVEELRKLKALEYNPEDVAFKGGVSNED